MKNFIKLQNNAINLIIGLMFQIPDAIEINYYLVYFTRLSGTTSNFKVNDV